MNKLLFQLASMTLFLLGLLSCGGESDDADEKNENIVSIFAMPNNIEIELGESTQATLFSIDRNGVQKEITSSFDWPSLSNQYISLNTDGKITANKLGETILQIEVDQFITEITIKVSITATGISEFTTYPIIGGGSINSEKWGDKPSIVNNNSWIHLKNDKTNLYALIDRMDDTSIDNPICISNGNVWSCNRVDYFSVFIDANSDAITTPLIDYEYGMCNELDIDDDYREFPKGYQVMQLPYISRINILSETTNNGCDSGGITAGSMFKGFGKTHNGNQEHRYFELTIPLNEICIATDGTTSIGFDLPEGEITKIQLTDVAGNGCLNPKDYIEVIYSDKQCNSFLPTRSAMVYVLNKHSAFKISAEITITDKNPINDTIPAIRQYELSPGQREYLGCSVSGIGPFSFQEWLYQVTDAVWAHAKN